MNVRNEYYNPDSDITYVVFAPRKLSKEEMMRAIVINLQLAKKKQKPKPGQTWEIFLPTVPEEQ